MDTYVLHGSIRPKCDGIMIKSLPTTFKVASLGFLGKFTISINSSQVSVIVRTETKVALDDILNLSLYYARTIVDTANFIDGTGFDVEIDSLILLNGELIVYEPKISKVRSSIDFSSFLSLILTASPYSIFLTRAIADLREAIIKPTDTGFLCYRAIESLKKFFSKPNDKDKRSWERVHEQLRIDEDYLKKIKNAGDERRHGGGSSLTSNDRIEIVEMTRKVIERFYYYSKNGGKPLSEADFEILK